MMEQKVNLAIDKQLSLLLLRSMLRIRSVEEGIAERYPQGKMRCPTHLSIGQEAAAVAVGAALENNDLAISTHRAHAHYLAKGGNLQAMLAEIYGKDTGCSRGRGGSMHLTDPSVGFIGSTAIVGNSIPVGVGLALSLQLQKSQNLSAVFFGDGCVEEGAFYESINFAAVRNLPTLFVCENNFYSVYSPLKVRQPKGRKIYKMVEAVGVKSALADGNDVESAYAAALAAIEHIRSGRGPFFLELTTYRWLEHCGPNYDNDIGYRSEEEFQKWKAKDPIPVYQSLLISRGWINQADIDDIQTELSIEVAAAFQFAESSSYPAQEEAYTGLYAGSKELTQ